MGGVSLPGDVGLPSQMCGMHGEGGGWGHAPGLGGMHLSLKPRFLSFFLRPYKESPGFPMWSHPNVESSQLTATFGDTPWMGPPLGHSMIPNGAGVRGRSPRRERSVHACTQAGGGGLHVVVIYGATCPGQGFRALGERTLQVCIHKVGRRIPPTGTPQDSQEGGGSGAQPPTPEWSVHASIQSQAGGGGRVPRARRANPCVECMQRSPPTRTPQSLPWPAGWAHQASMH